MFVWYMVGHGLVPAGRRFAARTVAAKTFSIKDKTTALAHEL
jgi:hypothetical protein